MGRFTKRLGQIETEIGKLAGTVDATKQGDRKAIDAAAIEINRIRLEILKRTIEYDETEAANAMRLRGVLNNIEASLKQK